MALHTKLPVYRDTYQLILRVFEITKEFNMGSGRRDSITSGSEIGWGQASSVESSSRSLSINRSAVELPTDSKMLSRMLFF